LSSLQGGWRLVYSQDEVIAAQLAACEPGWVDINDAQTLSGAEAHRARLFRS
jgi:hypothetical protein